MLGAQRIVPAGKEIETRKTLRELLH
jgi:hypothetical protein